MVEVRRGYSTDTFNELQRSGQDSPQGKLFSSDRAFSIIFDHRQSGYQSLDLLCPNSRSREETVEISEVKV